MTATKQQPIHAVDSESNSEKANNEKHIEAVKYKTKMCRNWVTKGCCPYNEKCMFAHGDHELRSVSLNTNQGLTTEDDIRRFRKSGHGTGPQAGQDSGRTTPPQQRSGEFQPPAQQPPRSLYHHNPYARQPYYSQYQPQPYEAPAPCQCPECVGQRYSYYAPPPLPPQPTPCYCEECMRAASYSYDGAYTCHPYESCAEDTTYATSECAGESEVPPTRECVAP